MQWWNDFVDWTSSDPGARLISGAIIPFVAIVVAGIVAALIGRGATKRVVTLQEREAKNAAVAGIVSAARKSATWGSLTHDERAYADHLAEDADIRLRLLPIPGAPLAANWAQHEIADIKKNSSTFSFQAEQSLAEFRDRMLEWQGKPSRARKLFKYDLERWKFESPDPDAELIKRQQAWNADQADTKRPQDAPPTPSTTSLRPAPVTPAASAPAATTRPGGSSAAATQVQPSVVPAPAPSGRAGSDVHATTPYGSDRSAVATDRDATTPYGDRNATTPYGDRNASTWSDRDATTPLDSDQSATTPYGDRNPTTPSGDRNATTPYGSDQTPTASYGRSEPTGAQGHGVDAAEERDGDPGGGDRSSELTAPKVDASGTTNTTSIPTRIAGAPSEPADADETDEAPYTQPISASELRRRSEDDDD